MDKELLHRAQSIYGELLYGNGRKGPIYGERFSALIFNFNSGNIDESLRSLAEHIAVLQARIEFLEAINKDRDAANNPSR